MHHIAMRTKGKVEDFLHTAGQAGAEGRFLTKPVLRCASSTRKLAAVLKPYKKSIKCFLEKSKRS